MTAVANEHRYLAEQESDDGVCAMRRSIVIITGLSLALWSVLGLVIYEIF